MHTVCKMKEVHWKENVHMMDQMKIGRVDEEGASGGDDEADAPGDMVIAILILVRMMKFNFN